MPGNSKRNKRPKNKLEKHRYGLRPAGLPIQVPPRDPIAERRRLSPHYDRACEVLGLEEGPEVEELASKYRRGLL